MRKHVIEFFKRNPEAVAAHIVLDTVFDSARAASRARKAWGARKVSVVLKQEYDTWVAEQSSSATPETKVEETS